jgi:glycosyltransferase involved in cell wall biosynthesis
MGGGDFLVSVIIRSTGRATLAASVDSVIRQSHRPIEIVIVNAGASRLREPASVPSVQIHVVEGGPRTRPQAANAGLAAAEGDGLVFLDDDDQFRPDHLETLLDALRESDDALLAYSATECIDAQGRSLGILERDFDRLSLFGRNYIQIGAALFSRRLVLEGFRFDETFECLQDWDFWIQLAHRTRFAYTGKPTNVWFAHSGASGCGMGPNSDSRQFDRFSDLLRRKWTPALTALQRKVAHHRSLAQSAMLNGAPLLAERHFAMAERFLRGSPPGAGVFRDRVARRGSGAR